jgi:hypothetical protein
MACLTRRSISTVWEDVAARRPQVRRAEIETGDEFLFEQLRVLPDTAAAYDPVSYSASRGNEA